MSNFKCEIMQIKVEEHPDPFVERLEVGKIGDFNVVVGKDLYKTGDHVIYVPENAIVPTWVTDYIGLTGKLGGSAKNRVRPVRLRGVLSEGIVLPLSILDNAHLHVLTKYIDYERTLGLDVAENLGITKYEPPIPIHMRGQAIGHSDIKLSFDIENIKKYPDLFKDGEEVVFTEKLHGTMVMCIYAAQPKDWRDYMIDHDVFVSSKGQGAKGICFKDVPENQDNVYIKTVKLHKLPEKARRLAMTFENKGMRVETLAILGEIYGVQKGYGYGTSGQQGFACFAIKVNGMVLSRTEFIMAAMSVDIPMVPTLYRGPFSKDLLKEHTDGKATIGDGKNIREGVVVTPVEEQYSPELHGRKILKSISEAYLKKSDGEEFS